MLQTGRKIVTIIYKNATLSRAGTHKNITNGLKSVTMELIARYNKYKQLPLTIDQILKNLELFNEFSRKQIIHPLLKKGQKCYMKISQKQKQQNIIDSLRVRILSLEHENKELLAQNESYIAWRLEVNSDARKKSAFPDNCQKWKKDYEENSNDALIREMKKLVDKHERLKSGLKRHA